MQCLFYQTLGPGCIIEKDVSYLGNDIKWEAVEDEQGCADLSASTSGGLFWTFITGSKLCYVKTSDSGRVANQNRVSGNRYCGTTYLGASPTTTITSTTAFSPTTPTATTTGTATTTTNVPYHGE